MLIDVEGYVKPASRESRLVMHSWSQGLKKVHKGQETENTRVRGNKSQRRSKCTRTFSMSVSWKHVAVGKGFMAAHAHDIRLKVRRKMSDVIGK